MYPALATGNFESASEYPIEGRYGQVGGSTYSQFSFERFLVDVQLRLQPTWNVMRRKLHK